jgi:hypothetical protein
MLSKELLSEVLGYEVYDISNYHEQRMADYKEDFISFKRYLNGCRRNPINIHELAHFCKEWAYKNGFILRSEYYPSDSFLFSGGCLLIDISTEESAWFNGTIEPEAVFKACEWILNNKQSVND